MSEGLNFLVRCLEEGSLEQFRRMPSEAFEVDEEEEEAHRYVIRHLRRHGRLPTVETLDEQVSFELPETPEPISYYRERLTTRNKYNGLREPFNSLRSAMGDADMEAAEDAVTQMVQTLRRTDDRSQILSTEQWGEQVISAYNEAHMIDGLIGVPTPWDLMNQDTGGWMGSDLNMFVARPEIGKAQPLDSLVLMRNGRWKRMGDLRVGDRLASPDRTPSKVEAIYPQGLRPTLEVEFVDGRVVECDEEHLWSVNSSRWPSPRTVTAAELRELNSEGRRERRRMYVPTPSGHYGSVQPDIDPYLVGVMLGDGCTRSEDVRITSADPEIIERVASKLPDGYYINSSGIDHRITHGVKGKENAVCSKLKELGIWGTLSIEKEIPDRCFEWVREARLELLRGIMDSDGWVQGAAHTATTQLGSSSERLALGVMRLCHSLGMVASVGPASNRSWRVTIHDDAWEMPFHLRRKAKRHMAREPAARGLQIVEVRPAGRKKCQCISVSHPSHLYVTDGYVLTHNTWVILCCLLAAAMSGRKVFMATTEMSPKAIGNRFYSMLAGVDHRLVRRGMLSTHAQQRLIRAKEFVDEVMNISIFGSDMGGNTLSLTAAVQDHAPDIVFIDGVYLMRPAAPPKNGQKNDIVASVLDDLKSLALQADIPIVGTSQFNRISGKAGKQGSLETIGFTDAFSTHCSVIYKVGLPGAGAQDTQTRILEVMKGREGESIPVPINFKFTPYNFGQTTMDMVAGRDGAEPPPEQNLDWME